jgi:hypothetical protein
MKMERLKKYLDNIRTFLPGRQPEKVDEILREIESHILEKAERERGEINDTSLAIAIKEYGSPEQVAARYYEDGPIIAPHLKNYLFMYTGIIFAIHIGLHLLSLIFGENGAIFRFSSSELLGVLSQLPVTFIFDLGLVCLVLYFVTKAGATSPLPYFTWFLKNEPVPSLAQRIATLVASIVGVAFTYLGFTYGPVYFVDGQMNTLAIAALDTMKYGLFLGFGILTISSIFNFINVFNYSRIVKIASDIAGLIFLLIVVSPDYSGRIADFLGISPESTGHPLLIGILVFITLVTIVELVIETIRFWASRIVASTNT